MEKTKSKVMSESSVSEALRKVCSTEFGVFNSSFLCQSIGTVNPPTPICVAPSTTLLEVVQILKTNKIGCVLVTDGAGILKGIFTERDCLLKVVGSAMNLATTLVEEVMTKDPIAEPPDTTIAFVLNLMSQGGFRHIPIVDGDRKPVAIVSVKDVLDHMVGSFVDSLLAFELPEV